MKQRRDAPIKRSTDQLGRPRERPKTGARTAVVAIIVALALAALRCSVDVPLGVDPRSDAANNDTDAGAGG